MTTATAMIGLLMLVGLALAVGWSMDGSTADARWRQVADERRQRNEERRRLEALHHEVHAERMRLHEEQEALRALRRLPLCSDCPLRSRPTFPT